METIEKFRHEFRLVKDLDPAWATVPLELALSTGQIGLTLTDPGGTPLSQILASKPPGFSETDLPHHLELAIAMATTLSKCHQNGLIHKDFKPDNLLVDLATQKVWLTGFKFASRILREQRQAARIQSIDGTFAYMAPEQTGRMNRSIDQRSDLYSLGMTCYELFTGALPFSATDPLEWVHCHIAVQAATPSERIPSIPAQISAIIMKLLAKTAEHRYQTAAGVAADFARCFNEWQQHGCISPFTPGEMDQSGQLMIPERLYGREHECQLLQSALDRVTQNDTPELLLVSGYSGVGKTALVNQLYRPLMERASMYGTGKFDQHKQDIPYATFAQAFHVLVRQILSGDEEGVKRHAANILAAVGRNGQLIVDLIPQIELVIGTQPPVPELTPAEAQFRFLQVFTRFMCVFARPQAPLVLFLDDIQWMDGASIKLMRHIMTSPDVRNLLLIVAYRDNEMHSAHPAMLALNAIRANGSKMIDIVLHPLLPSNLHHLVTDALRCPATQTHSLAQLVFEKTAGNPFFSIQFLLALTEERLLNLDPKTHTWAWDIASIQNKGFSDNVVELMTGKLQKLAPSSLLTLQRLACLGISSTTTALGMIFDRSSSEVVSDAEDALHGCFLFMHDTRIAFAHDRIREAAYGTLPEAERAAAHLHIGRRLLAAMSDADIADDVFDVVYQLNLGATLIDNPVEQARVYQLNILAGKRAKASTAYHSAHAYFTQAKSLMAANAWQQAQNETFDLFVDLSECEHLTGNHDQAEALFQVLFKNAQTDEQRTKVCRLRLRVAMVSGRYGDAVNIAIEGLALFGLVCPQSDAEMQADIDACRAELKLLVGERKFADLAATPVCVQPKVLALMGILADAIPCAYNVRPLLYPYMILKDLVLSLKYGVTGDSSTAFSSYAVVLVARYGEIDSAFEFSSLALALNERFANNQIAGTLIFRHGYFVTPWRRPISLALEILEDSFTACVETGNLVYATYTAAFSGWLMFEKGAALETVLAAIHKFISFARNSRIGWPLNAIHFQEMFIAELQGIPANRVDAKAGNCSAADSLAALNNANFGHGIAFCHVIGQIMPLLLGRYEEALAACQVAASMSIKVAPAVIEATHYFYYALTITALFEEATPEQQETFLNLLQVQRDKLRLWANSCRENFICRHTLVEAEMARIERRNIEAMRLYEQAITQAHETGQLHCEALANERAGLFCINRGLSSVVNTYLGNARYAYLRWGAHAKVQHMDQLYPQLANERRNKGNNQPVVFDGHIDGLDMIAVVKAQQAVSGEIVLDKLMEALLRIVVEHAGASRGLLILRHNDDYRIGASALACSNQIDVSSVSLPLSSFELPMALFQYAARTRERVVVDDATAENDFHTQNYAWNTGTKSILCLPVVNRGKLSAVVYLENRLVASAFTHNHIKALDLLASQAAISLENAILYAELEDRVEARTHALNQSLSDLRRTQTQLIQSEKMAALGQLIANVAHEINTPISAIKSSSEIIAKGLNNALDNMQQLLDVLDTQPRKLFSRLISEASMSTQTLSSREERTLKDQVARQLNSASVPCAEQKARTLVELQVHANALDYLPLLTHPECDLILKTSGDITNIVRGSGNIVHAVDRVSKIITTLKSFNETKHSHQMGEVNLKEGIEAALALYKSHLRNGTNLVCQYEALPNLHGFPDGLMQVWTHLIHNALQAMNYKGQLIIDLKQIDDDAVVAISDSGCGIPEAIRERIFEPFFTTQPLGEGSGLGLDIVKRIVAMHHGRIDLQSEVGVGSTFSIFLPLTPPTSDNQHLGQLNTVH